MTFKHASATMLLVLVATASPALAKSKPKPSSKPATGVFCEQGGDNAYFPASGFKPSLRKALRVGERIKINIAGVGPLNCRVY